MNKPDRAAWLADRRLGVGGSECAAALGLDENTSTRELYERKLGNMPEIEDNDRMAAGRHIEPAIATWAAEKYGLQLYQRHQVLTHPKHDFMRANVDRLVRSEKSGVEIKNVDRLVVKFSGLWGEDGSSEVPLRYYLQCMHYMEVLGYPVWYLIACIGGNELRRYVIERDRELCERIVYGLHDFWQHVEHREPPDFDADHPSTTALLKKLYPGSTGEVIQLPADMLHWHATLEAAKKERDSYDDVAEGAKRHLLKFMKEAAVAKLPGGGEYRRKVIERKGYTVEPCEYVDFRFAKPKQKGASHDE